MPDIIIRFFDWIDTSHVAAWLFGWLLVAILVAGFLGEYIHRGRKGVRGLDHGEWY